MSILGCVGEELKPGIRATEIISITIKEEQKTISLVDLNEDIKKK